MFLKVLFSLIFLGILGGTVEATLDRGVWTALRDLWPDPWFRATLYDAYFAFTTICVWVGFKEHKLFARVLWWVLIMVFGNLAISSYMLIQLFRLKPNEPVSHIFLIRRPD